MIVHRTRRQTHRARACALGLLLAVVAPALASAQQPDEPPPPRRALTLDEAIRLAAKESEQLQIARAGVSRASGQLRQARSGYLPQLNSNLQYARALRSQFSALASGNTADTSTAPKPQSLCTPPLSNNPTQAERAAALAAATTCPSAQGIDFSRVGFDARNSWTLGLKFSQNVFTGGRVSGQTTLARQVGNTSEFELLRATVTRDNQRPVVIARRGDRDVAYFRLKQLLNLPLDQPLSLVTPIEQPETVTRIIAANATTQPTA